MHKTKPFSVFLIYIGQSPRPDMAGDMRALLCDAQPGGITITESGALDRLSGDEIAALAPGEGEHLLVSKLADGSDANLCEERMEALLQGRIDAAEREGADAIAIMCTGSFPGLHSNKPLLACDAVFHRDMRFEEGFGKAGVIVPMESQREAFAGRFAARGITSVSAAASPYGDTAALVNAAAGLKAMGAECICLDCMGYSLAQARAVEAALQMPVRTPREEMCMSILTLYNNELTREHI